MLPLDAPTGVVGYRCEVRGVVWFQRIELSHPHGRCMFIIIAYHGHGLIVGVDSGRRSVGYK